MVVTDASIPTVGNLIPGLPVDCPRSPGDAELFSLGDYASNVFDFAIKKKARLSAHGQFTGAREERHVGVSITITLKTPTDYYAYS